MDWKGRNKQRRNPWQYEVVVIREHIESEQKVDLGLRTGLMNKHKSFSYFLSFFPPFSSLVQAVHRLRESTAMPA